MGCVATPMVAGVGQVGNGLAHPTEKPRDARPQGDEGARQITSQNDEGDQLALVPLRLVSRMFGSSSHAPKHAEPTAASLGRTDAGTCQP